MLHIVSQTGGPEKNKKYDTSGVLFTGLSVVKQNKNFLIEDRTCLGLSFEAI